MKLKIRLNEATELINQMNEVGINFLILSSSIYSLGGRSYGKTE
jgi:hypothetical protein